MTISTLIPFIFLLKDIPALKTSPTETFAETIKDTWLILIILTGYTALVSIGVYTMTILIEQELATTNASVVSFLSYSAGYLLMRRYSHQLMKKQQEAITKKTEFLGQYGLNSFGGILGMMLAILILNIF